MSHARSHLGGHSVHRSASRSHLVAVREHLGRVISRTSPRGGKQTEEKKHTHTHTQASDLVCRGSAGQCAVKYGLKLQRTRSHDQHKVEDINIIHSSERTSLQAAETPPRKESNDVIGMTKAGFKRDKGTATT